MSMDVISLRIARHVGTEACFSPVEQQEGSVQVDLRSTVGPPDAIPVPTDKKSARSRAQSSVLLLNNSRSTREFRGESEHGTEGRLREGD